MATEYIEPDDKAVINIDQNKLPSELLILPVIGQVAFPTLNMSLTVSEKAIESIEAAMKGSRLIGVVVVKNMFRVGNAT